MITVPEVVETIVRRSPYLEEALGMGIINLSSLARQIQPEIQEKLFKDIQAGAIIMALKRLETRLQKQQIKTSPLLKSLGDITVRSNLAEYTFSNSPTLAGKGQAVLEKKAEQKGAFFTLTEGVLETTLIISAVLQKEAGKVFAGENLVSKFENLSAITLNLPKETVQTPGVYYMILKTLAWNGINVVEVVSSFTELTIVLEDDQIDKAFSVLKKSN